MDEIKETKPSKEDKLKVNIIISQLLDESQAIIDKLKDSAISNLPLPEVNKPTTLKSSNKTKRRKHKRKKK